MRRHASTRRACFRAASLHEMTEGFAVANECWYRATSLADFCSRLDLAPAAGRGAKR
eukprot:NODE_5968_length_663_cov_3.833876_g5055_i0.p6 GENE.NODE_5968_length_663_cov_3.833876_g5055_i0~~NODE_5968_length_663_cov_3.833876_g5055_i0.p6  ORF type:complete len:57 (-),score=1.82 NODE_5968_length_663_cov_3.833876_g5055_i0:45-215(-)